MSALSDVIANGRGNMGNELYEIIEAVSGIIDPNDKTAQSLHDVAKHVSGIISVATKQDTKTKEQVSGSTQKSFDRNM